MIAFDTNLLVRLLVQDGAKQFAAATALLETAAEAQERCYLSDAVLCETEWVLTSLYGAGRGDVLSALSELVADARYTFDDAGAVADAIGAFEKGRAEFSDYLIGTRARGRGARTTYTFDRKLRNQEGFTLVR